MVYLATAWSKIDIKTIGLFMQVPGKCTEEEFSCLCRSWQETWQRRVWPQLQTLHTIRWGEEKRRAFGRRGA